MKQQPPLSATWKNAQVQQSIVKLGIAQDPQPDSISSHITDEGQGWPVANQFTISFHLQSRKAVLPEGPPDWPKITKVGYMSFAAFVHAVDDVSIEASPQDSQEVSAINAAKIHRMGFSSAQQGFKMSRPVAKTKFSGNDIFCAGWHYN